MLSKAGDKFVEAVNGQFMYDQMEAAKNFSVRLGNGIPGAGTQFELGVLDTAVKIGRNGEIVKNSFYVTK